MQRLAWWIGWMLALGGWSGAADPSEAWTNRVARFVAAPRFAKAAWGVELVDLKSGRVLFATNEHRLLQPASNQKLFTAAWALNELGPQARMTTELRATGKIDANGVLHGDLVVSGTGDPAWASGRELPGMTNSWKALLGLIEAAHIKKVAGQLVADTTRVTGSRWGKNRLAGDLIHPYGAEIGALNLHENFVDVSLRPGGLGLPLRLEVQPPTDYLGFKNDTLTVGSAGEAVVLRLDRRPLERKVRITGALMRNSSPASFDVTVPNPPEWFLDTFRRKLKEAGVEVRGADRVLEFGEAPPGGAVLGEVKSPALIEIARVMLKESQNLYAECVFRFAGEKLRGSIPLTATSEEAAVLNLTDWLVSRGIPRPELHIEDGSGLSRGDRASAHAFVTLLRWTRDWENLALFQALLPVAGVDGTLQRRFVGSRLKNRLWAKTGSLNGVATLSGFMEGPRGEALAFSALLNDHSPVAGKSAREEIDDLMELIGCSP